MEFSGLMYAGKPIEQLRLSQVDDFVKDFLPFSDGRTPWALKRDITEFVRKCNTQETFDAMMIEYVDKEVRDKNSTEFCKSWINVAESNTAKLEREIEGLRKSHMVVAFVSFVATMIAIFAR